MLARVYLAAGAALLVGFAVSSFAGWELRPAERAVPAAGAALAASAWGRSSRSSGGSVWYSSSTRSGGSVFGGK